MCLADDSDKYINGTKLTAMGISKLIFAAYENACIIDDAVPTLTFGNYVEWVEDMIIENPAELERVVTVFSDSKYTAKLAERTGEVDKLIDDVKKKLSGTTSKVSPSSSSASRKKSTTSVRTGSTFSARKGTNVQKKKEQRPKK